jgi:hypothetical protein
MGLDVYLYTKAQQLQNEAHDREEREFYGEDWELYDLKSDAEKEAFRNNRQYEYTCNTDVPAKAYPEGNTLNNRRYLRSSYNGGGFNSAVPNYLGREAGYEWMFADAIDVRGGEYSKWWTPEHVDALETARTRAMAVAKELKSLETPLNVTTVSPNLFGPSPTADAQAALTWARSQLEREKEMGEDNWFKGGWQNAEGHYFTVGESLKVVAAVPGEDYFGKPAVHLVYRAEGALESYVESATIAGEFAEEAIDLIKQDGSCYVYWSG